MENINRCYRFDVAEDIVEYRIYKQIKEREEEAEKDRLEQKTGGWSVLIAFLCILAGIMVLAVLYSVLKIHPSSVPGALSLFCWMGISGILGLIAKRVFLK